MRDWSRGSLLSLMEMCLALIGLFIILGPTRVSAQSLDIEAAVSSASMANRAGSWQATWSAAAAANDGLGVMPDIVWQENGRHDSDGLWRVIRPFLVFPISGIPAGAQITGASLILRISRIEPPFQSTYDDQTYVRVVRATPQDPPGALTASDFGRVAFGTLYSGKHFVQDMTVDTDVVIPLDAALFGELTNGNTLTLALINGHELENVDHWPNVNVHTHFFTAFPPSSGTPPLLRIVADSLFLVAININPNTINLRSRGNILVAILSTNDFNAPTTVRMSSLTFGRTGNEQSLTRCNTGDVNEDGLPDLICQFESQTAAFQAGDTKGILKGATIEGTPFQGEDPVRIIP